ncbi:baseplate J/gp47 family protein [Paraburkholderia sp. BR14263]|uniref:baseplate J/gp47 family protein n=1 Tax=unclassified Paraburkholderia TaxID=2615204 RepID=UPI0034CE03B3
MPYSRPTLTQLRNQIWTDITSALGLVVSLLQKAVLKIVGAALAALVFGLYGYLDWIAKQAVPFTAEDEYLAGWGALKSTYLKAATSAVLTAQFTGSAGRTLAAGTSVTRADQFVYTVVADATVDDSNTVTVQIQAVTTGTAGNCDDGTEVSLTSALAGIQSTGTVTSTVTAGTDVEKQETYRSRVMQAYQEPPQGGAKSDYVKWAEDVSIVTRAWCRPNRFGVGTVVVYIMCDEVRASNGGFPQGADGVSQYDPGQDDTPRGVVATGDQLTVADALITEQPVTALVYACSPIKNVVGFTIGGLSTASSATQSAIGAAISDVFYRLGEPEGTIDLSDIEGAIGAVPKSRGFLIKAVTSTVGGVTTTYPVDSDITSGTGQLPTLGTIDWV